MPEKQNGSIEIKGGKVFISDPVGDGLPAIVGPDPLAEIKVNGIPVEAKQGVNSSDKVEITPREEVFPGTVTVEVSKDRLQAAVIITPRITVKRRLKDTPPAQELILHYEEEKIKTNEVTVQEVYDALKGKGVVYGLDAAAIEKAVQDAGGQPVVVARGKEAIQGRDGYVELLFEPGIKITTFDEESVEKVDYKERIVIPSVNEGDLMAIIHPPVPGIPGCLVTGETIEPHPVQEVTVVCKDGCMLNEQGDRVLATRAGRPLAEGKKHETLRVLNVHVHNGDVDLKSGNLHFGGDLKITGNILEGMIVECLGNLQVMGHTAGAKIVAGGSIVFQNNLINSKVTAGLLKGFYRKISPCLSELLTTLNALKGSLSQLEETLSRQGKKIDARQSCYLIRLLVERKYVTLPQMAENMLKFLKETKFPPPAFLEETLKATGALLRNIQYFQSKEQFTRLIEDLHSAASYVEQAQQIQGDIIASYVQNSYIESSGNITVRGAGSYNTFFQAGGDVHIEGVFRGGEIKAEGNIFVGEAGSPGLTLKQGGIYLSAESTARFRKVYENVKIFFGKRGFQFKETRSMVKVFYSLQEDMIRVVNI